MEPIKLNDVLNIKDEDLKKFSIFFNNGREGDYVYSFRVNRNRLMEHISWKRHRNENGKKKKSFRVANTPYVLEFLRLDDISHEWWLFLGAYKINKEKPYNTYEDGHQTYNLELMDLGKNLVERLIVYFKKSQGATQAKVNIDKIDEIDVIKILEKPYIDVAEKFDGYDNIKLDFEKLETIVNSNVDSWRVSLSNVNGIYVIADKKSGLLYVGSAYGKGGIWQRWSSYVYSHGTGGNKALDELISKDPNYAKNFQFSILEVITNRKLSVDDVVQRENHWKEILLTRTEGLNRN